jgi:hypothetical protein
MINLAPSTAAGLGMNRTFFLPSEVLTDGDYGVGTNCATPDQAHCLWIVGSSTTLLLVSDKKLT